MADLNENTPALDSESQLKEMAGAFVASLKRNNKDIRNDRALAIAEDAQMYYKREIEDLSTKIKRKKRDLANMLDLSPENTTTLKLASDFDAKIFVTKDIDLSVAIRQEEIKLEESKKRYKFLFGEEI